MAKSLTRAQTLKGNKNGTKLKDPDVRQKAYSCYCAHLAKGKSHKSWCFIHPQFTCTYETIERYIEENPTEFDPLKKKIALTQGFNYWEQVVEDHAEGNNDAVTPALQMVMRNKFGWDREEKAQDQGPSDSAKFQLAQAKALGDQNASTK